MKGQLSSILPIAVMIISAIISFYISRIVFKYSNKSNLQELSKAQAQKFLSDSKNSKYLQWMSEYGYMYKHGYDVEVSTFIIERIGCTLLFIIASYLIFKNILISVIAGILGFFLIKFAYKIQNELDNNEMEADIRNLRDTMIIHAEAGVQLKDTLLICMNESENIRFKQAINEFYNYLITQKLTIKEALEIFEYRFHNKKITEICVIIAQSLETGSSVKMLDSLIENAESEEEANNYKKEKSLDRKMLFIMLIYFSFILVNVFYSVVVSISKSFKLF